VHIENVHIVNFVNNSLSKKRFIKLKFGVTVLRLALQHGKTCGFDSSVFIGCG